MRSETEIHTRTEEIRSNLARILEKTTEEIEKPYNERDYRLLKFLNRERNVWEFALQQMEWLLTDN